MNKKRWILVIIILFPSAIWLVLEMSTINSKRLPIYGPKKVIQKSDTLFYKVDSEFYTLLQNDSVSKTKSLIATDKFPLYAICFLKNSYSTESYRVTGLWEYLNYKRNKIEHIPFFLVSDFEKGSSKVFNHLKKMKFENVNFVFTEPSKFDSINKIFFNQKPYFVDYSFFVLIDGERRIRGYYDGRYVAEIKRLIDEYQHLRLKEEKKQMIDANEIKKEN